MTETNDPLPSTPSERPARETAPFFAHAPSRQTLMVFGVSMVLSLWLGAAWGRPAWQGLSTLWHKAMAGPRAGSADTPGHNHGQGGGGLAAAAYFTCGMHPWVILPKPGNCPICQMKLTPLDPKKFTGEVSINPLMVQNIGVRVADVTQGPLVKSIRTVGAVDFDETRVRDVNVKINGWIEKLYVDYLGAPVTANQPLFDLYSPELYAAQEEYLLAWRNKSKIKADFLPDAQRNALSLLEASKTKLEYFDITDQQIAELQARDKPSKTMTIRSPHGGVVIAKHANEGMKVDPGMQMYRIADLSKVWVMVTLYEYQLPFVSEGQKAVMTLPYIPGQVFEGKVIYVYPYLDSKTRQVKVRLEFDNENHLLKPGMFANVELKNTLAEKRTLVPRAAVLDTGQRQVAFVSLGEGKFEPRQVQMGVDTDDGRVEILDGLKPGEKVVISGQFLLDSEAKIRDSLVRMIKGESAVDPQAMASLTGKSHLQSLPHDVAHQLIALLDAYDAIGKAMAQDKLEGVEENARSIATAVDALIQLDIPEAPHFWHTHEEIATVRGKGLELSAAKAIKPAREIYGDLSVALSKLMQATGVPSAYGKSVQWMRCPMYREGQGGGIWLQTDKEVRNPFFGSLMLRCFDQRAVLPVTGESQSEATPKADQPALDQKPGKD